MEGVKISSPKVFENADGKVMHMMKSDNPDFTRFGEIYFSVINPGIIKGWHKRIKATRRYVVIKGNILLVLYDDKEYQEIKMGDDNYLLVTIPPGIWSSFKAIGGEAIVADLVDIPYADKDAEKADITSLNDYWKEDSK